MQDLFSDASGVASIITQPDGTPITNISNFCRLCNNIIRKTEKGKANCYHSDAIIGRQNPSGPIVQPCLSGGLWDAGASITVGGKHIANWLIGQVRNEELDEQRMIRYADEIGANREDFMEALNEVPVMSLEQFRKISKMLFAFANELSEKAYNNFQLKMQIAESKQAGETILNEQLLLRTVIDNIPDSIYCKDLAYRKTLANLTELRYLGVKSEAEILGKDDFDFYPKELAEKFFADDQSVINTGNPVINREEYILDEKEQKRWLLSSKLPLRDKDGQIIGLVGIGRDVTESKLINEKLMESEKKYRDIFENTLEGIFQTRINGSYISVNPALAKMYGFESPEELMKSRTDLSKDAYYDPKERDNFLKIIAEQGFIKNYEYEVKHKDGHKIWFDEDARAVKDKDGKVQYFEGFVIDITERKQAEAEIKFKNEELLKSNAEKDKFFSIIAHDLRSPFNSFLGLT
ncbi:MAG: pas/pac sensor signal transduction histidine kinase, partial [uncultured bacterium]